MRRRNPGETSKDDFESFQNRLLLIRTTTATTTSIYVHPQPERFNGSHIILGNLSEASDTVFPSRQRVSSHGHQAFENDAP